MSGTLEIIRIALQPRTPHQLEVEFNGEVYGLFCGNVCLAQGTKAEMAAEAVRIEKAKEKSS